MFTSVKGTFFESKEGNTYIRMMDHDRLAKHVVATLRGPCGNLEKWNYKVDQMKSVQVINEQDVEFVNLDSLLYSLLYEYKN